LTCRRSLEHDRIFGYESLLPEWTYATFLDHVVSEDRVAIDQEFQSAVAAQDDVGFECRILRADAQVHWVLFAGRHRVGAGGTRHMAGIVRDVTEHKMAEQERLEVERRLQQSQRLESLGVLAGGIAHDFNNILTGILGNAELGLVGLPASAAARANLQEIAKASTRAAGLCREMLAYAGRGQFASELIDFGALVEDLLDLLRTSISKKALLSLDLTKGMPRVLGDSGQLSQVIMNLVINASDAVGEKGGVIRISTGAIECSSDYLAETYATQNIAPGLYLALEVSDTGCGMDRDTLSHIFEPFFTTKFTGRGLGLAAVLGIVRGHKGTLMVTSEPGRGSTFKVLLPVAEAKRGAPEGEGATGTGNWRGQGTVLLVDDEEAIRAISGSMLSHLGFSVICAADGQEALELYSAHRQEVVLVLLDLTMPNMDGEETFNALRCLDPGAPVVLSSGYAEHDIASRFAGKGLSGFIQKPYSLAQLQQRVRAALEGGE
jgi:PAS domain S-box-containing protein